VYSRDKGKIVGEKAPRVGMMIDVEDSEGAVIYGEESVTATVG
jgi:hypothetical protein